METLQDKINQMSIYTSKLLSKNFGRGPEYCYLSVGLNFLIFHIRGFLTPIEEALLLQGHTDSIEISRSIVIESLLPELKGMLQVTLDAQVKEFYHDWNLPNNTGMIAAVLDTVISTDDVDHEIYPQKQLLEKEVARISELVEKVPDKIWSYRVSPQIYLVFREGIMVPIEKALIAKGYQQILTVTKDDMEKRYHHHSGRYTEIFQHPFPDIFLDWNFKDDLSFFCLILK